MKESASGALRGTQSSQHKCCGNQCNRTFNPSKADWAWAREQMRADCERKRHLAFERRQMTYGVCWWTRERKSRLRKRRIWHLIHARRAVVIAAAGLWGSSACESIQESAEWPAAYYASGPRGAREQASEREWAAHIFTWSLRSASASPAAIIAKDTLSATRYISLFQECAFIRQSPRFLPRQDTLITLCNLHPVAWP